MVGTTPGSVSFTVADIAALRAHVGDTLHIGNEDFTVTGLSGSTITANRSGTSLHTIGTKVYNTTRGAVIARNDDYYSNDAALNVTALDVGMYFIGVTSTGNLDYNPEAPAQRPKGWASTSCG